MATKEQEFMFGDFGDLSPEEHERVHGILHGSSRRGSSKVEFPWVDGADNLVGAIGGGAFNGQAWMDETPEYMLPGNSGYQDNSYADSLDYSAQYGYSGGSETSPAGAHFMMEPDQLGAGPTRMEETVGSQSRFQASLKQYQRRNKKKRPANYYNSDPSNSEMSDVPMTGNDPALYPQQYNSTTVVDGRLSQTSFGQEYKLGGTQHQNTPTYPNMNASYPAQTVANQNFSGGDFMEYDSFTNRNVSYANSSLCNQDGPPQTAERLLEVVVEQVPDHCVRNMPERTEMHPGEHPERTSLSYPPTSVVNTYLNTGSGDVNASKDGDPSANVNAHLQNTVTSISHVSSLNHSVPAHSGRVSVSANDAFIMDYSSHPGQQPVHSNLSGQSPHQGQPPFLGQPQEPTSDTVNQVLNSQQHDVQATVPNYAGMGSVNVSSVVNASSVNSTTAMEHVESIGDHATAMPLSDSGTSDSANPAVVPVSHVSVNSTPTTPSIPESKPKATSWAGLFKSSASPVVVVDQPFPSVKSEHAGKQEVEERSQKEVSPQPVPATEDSVAKQLGELLSAMTISHSSVCLQPRGLINRGNWCYINGTLQALIACPPFYSLLKKLPRYPVVTRGPSSTPILDALVEFVHEFQPMSRTTERGARNRVREVSPGVPFEPSYVYKMLQVIAVNPHFKLGKQEDAEEFLSCILDGMHEEMSAAVMLTEKHSPQEAAEDREDCTFLHAAVPPEDDGYTNGYVEGDHEEECDSQSEESWEQVGPKKKSVQTRRAQFAKTPIADIFAGMIRSAVHKAASKETATLEPFFTLQLDIQAERVCSVRDALEGLVSKEPISGYTCPKTKSELEVWKKLSLEELPPVLILHLKFFVYNKDGGSQKLMKRVDYPVELEITKDLLSPNARNKLSLQQRSYKLFAVVYHHGKTSTGGHYTTSVFHPGINGWVHSDDSMVRTTVVSNVLKYIPPRVPYLLYYRRLDSH